MKYAQSKMNSLTAHVFIKLLVSETESKRSHTRCAVHVYNAKH